MQPSLMGLAVCAALLAVGRLLGAPVTVGLIASLAFGSTAVATLGAVGGSSPLIYMVFALLLLAMTGLRRKVRQELVTVVERHPASWLVLLLTVYAICGAILLPRLFAGQTSAFIPLREQGLVAEVPLAPVPGNITQTAYFTLGAMAFFALSAMLLHRRALDNVRKGFFAWAVLIAGSGVIDLLAKMAGAGDVFLPLRTATYALVTEVEQAGFWRIVGLFPEASSFGAAALAALAFSFTYWRATGSRLAFLLAVVLAALVLLSTSSTAYAGFGILLAITLARMVGTLLAGRLAWADLVVLALFALSAAGAMAVLVHDRHAFEGFETLFRVTILEKQTSTSGMERAFWNERSLHSVLDTYALGIGLGSSRSSNWVISVLSQLGLVGAVLQGLLVIVLAHAPDRQAWRNGPVIALHDSVRAAALTALLCGTIAGGGADPGLLFFLSLATVLACRSHLAAGAPAHVGGMVAGHAVAAVRGTR